MHVCSMLMMTFALNKSNADHARTRKSGRVDMTGADEENACMVTHPFIHTVLLADP